MDIPSHTRQPHPAGLTFIELLTTLAILAILATTALPTLRTLLMDNRMNTQINALFTALQYARSLAITRQQHTLMCPSTDQTGCADAVIWQSGWIMFADGNANQRRDTGEPLARVQTQTAPGLTITAGGGRKRIVFQSDGTAGGSNLTLTFCDARGAPQARAIILATTGRPRISRTAADGGALSCPP